MDAKEIKIRDGLKVAISVILSHHVYLKPTQRYELLHVLARQIPQKLIRAWSGKQTKQLTEQAQRYQIAVDGPSIDLSELLQTLFAHFTRIQSYYSRWLTGKSNGDTLLDGENSPALERYREEKFRLARLDRQERERELLPREQIHEQLTRLANILHTAGEAIGREYGARAQEILNDAIADWERELPKE